MVIQHHLSTADEIRSIQIESLSNEILEAVKRGQAIRDLTSGQMMDCFYEIYRSWALPSHPMYAKYRNAGLSYLLSFIHPDSVKKLLAKGLRSETAMDRISDAGGFTGLAVPRGVVGHWVAGNVPMLSLISVLQAVLTKNISIVKLSTKQEDWISPFLRSLADTGPVGKAIAESVFVLSYPGEWREANSIVAEYSDVRIAWGGREAVESVAALPGKTDSGTLIFGPRFSCAAIDPSLMNEKDWIKLARDSVLFQQLACTSPHAVIVKGDAAAAEAAGLRLSEAFEVISANSYFDQLEAGEAVMLLEYRTSTWMQGQQLMASKGTEWTIHLHPRLEPFSGQGMRIVHLYPCLDWQEAVRCFPDSIQTVSHRLDESDLNSLVYHSKYTGVSRFVPVGEAHTYDIPWDGMLVLDQLVRWIRVDRQH